MTEPTANRTPRPKPALASRLMLAGAATGAGLAMVGAMAAAAASEPAAPTVRRIVVVDTSTSQATPGGSTTVPALPSPDATFVPAPTTDAPPVVESGGS